MKYRLNLGTNWRVPPEIYYPGIYRVPEDMDEETARRAVAEKNATLESVEAANKPENPAHPTQGRRKKGPAPENRMIDRAPENKEGE